MRIDPNNPHDFAWFEATRVERRRPHGPVRMDELSVKSPIESYVCRICKATEYSSSGPPVCRGGYEFRD